MCGGVVGGETEFWIQMNAFDFSAIEEQDPSVADGHRVLYDREVPVEIRDQTVGGGFV